jgi:hypothetical protein
MAEIAYERCKPSKRSRNARRAAGDYAVTGHDCAFANHLARLNARTLRPHCCAQGPAAKNPVDNWMAYPISIRQVALAHHRMLGCTPDFRGMFGVDQMYSQQPAVQNLVPLLEIHAQQRLEYRYLAGLRRSIARAEELQELLHSGF